MKRITLCAVYVLVLLTILGITVPTDAYTIEISPFEAGSLQNNLTIFSDPTVLVVANGDLEDIQEIIQSPENFPLDFTSPIDFFMDLQGITFTFDKQQDFLGMAVLNDVSFGDISAQRLSTLQFTDLTNLTLGVGEILLLKGLDEFYQIMLTSSGSWGSRIVIEPRTAGGIITPEPSTAILMGLGLLGMYGMHRVFKSRRGRAIKLHSLLTIGLSGSLLMVGQNTSAQILNPQPAPQWVGYQLALRETDTNILRKMRGFLCSNTANPCDSGCTLLNVSEWKADDVAQFFEGNAALYYITGEESLYEAMKLAGLHYTCQLDTFSFCKPVMSGWCSIQHPKFDVEHSSEGNGVLVNALLLKPHDRSVSSPLEDYVEHFGNWKTVENGQPLAEWFNWQTNHFKTSSLAVQGPLTVNLFDYSMNLRLVGFALSTYRATQNPQYLAWVKAYLDGWITTMERNNARNGINLMPAAADPETGGVFGDWWKSPGLGFDWTGSLDGGMRAMPAALLSYYEITQDRKYLDALINQINFLFSKGSSLNQPAAKYDPAEGGWVYSRNAVKRAFVMTGIANAMDAHPDTAFHQKITTYVGNDGNHLEYVLWQARNSRDPNLLNTFLRQGLGRDETIWNRLSTVNSRQALLDKMQQDCGEVSGDALGDCFGPRGIEELFSAIFGAPTSGEADVPLMQVLYQKPNGTLGLPAKVAAAFITSTPTSRVVQLYNNGATPETILVQAGFTPRTLRGFNINGIAQTTFTDTLATLTIPPGNLYEVELLLNSNQTPNPLTIATTSVPDGEVDKAYSMSLQAQGGVAPYVWSVSSGNLPVGLSLNTQTGAITGTPTETGTFTLTIQLADSQTPPVRTSKTFTTVIKPSSTASIGTFAKWAKIEIQFPGPNSVGSGSPNPFDILLDVTFTSPTGKTYVVPGFYNGNGQGGMDGKLWQVRFSADEVGRWTFATNSPNASLNGQTGSFTVTAVDPNASGFYKFGRLETTNSFRYLKFRDGPYWLKAGADDPENFLGTLSNYDTLAERKLAIDYLASKGINSLYIMTHKLDGDGKDVWPWYGQDANTAKTYGITGNVRFDIARIEEWRQLFEYMQTKGVVPYLILEDDSAWSGYDHARYYRELIARFGDLPAVLFNFCEEYNEHYALDEALANMADLKRIDPYNHPRGIHNVNTPEPAYTNASQISFASIQTKETNPLNNNGIVNSWIQASRPNLMIGVDEPRPHNRQTWWSIYLGGGVVEAHPDPLNGSYDFPMSTWEPTWTQLGGAHAFMESLPYWEMSPQNALVASGQAFCLTKTGEVYALYLPVGGTIAVSLASGASYEYAWWNPSNSQNGQFQNSGTISGGMQTFSAPGSGDWALKIQRSVGTVTITTASLPAGQKGVPYSATLVATGGVSPYAWTITAGQLPQGLILNAATGTLSGTPTSAGTVSLTITVTDSQNTTATKTLSLVINPASSGCNAWITDITAASGIEYRLDTIAIGKLFYSDRDHTVTALPAAYQGSCWIRTANNDKFAQSPQNFLTFTVSQPVTILIGYDARLTLPAWLQSWATTGEMLKSSDTEGKNQFILYRQNFPAGVVALGPNMLPSGISGSMYTVLIKETACVYTITPTSQPHGARAENGTVKVTDGSGCGWTATSNVSWISITSGSPGEGHGTVTYTVAANPTANPRTGTLTIAGQQFTVTQAAASAGTVPIFYVALNGDDTNPGTIDRPWKTILYALKHGVRGKLQAGENIVYVRGGTYPDTDRIYLDVPNIGYPTDPALRDQIRLRILAYPGEKPVVNSAWIWQTAHIEISGFSFKGPRVYPAGLKDMKDVKIPTELRSVNIDPNAPEIDLTLPWSSRQAQVKARYPLVWQLSSYEYRDNYQAGIFIYNSRNVTISKNEIAYWGNGIGIENETSELRIEGNTIHHCVHGLWAWVNTGRTATRFSLEKAAITNNTFRENLRYGLAIGGAPLDGDGVVIQGNCAEYNGTTHYGIGAGKIIVQRNIGLYGGYYSELMEWPGASGVSVMTGSSGTINVDSNYIAYQFDITGADGHGFITDQSQAKAIFTNNIAYRNMGSGITLHQAAASVVANNTCVENGYHSTYVRQWQAYRAGIRILSDPQPHVIVNNLLVNNYATNFLSGAAARNGLTVFDYNGYVQPAGSPIGNVENRNIYPTTPFGAHDRILTSANTIFVNAGQLNFTGFHLSANAIALIDKGTSNAAPANDIDGHPRPQNARDDIGADEFVGTPAATTVTLTIKKKGTGTGTILVGTQTCDAACSTATVQVSPNTAFVLKAIPTSDSTFVRWENEQGQPLQSPIQIQAVQTIWAVFAKHPPSPLTCQIRLSGPDSAVYGVAGTWRVDPLSGECGTRGQYNWYVNNLYTGSGRTYTHTFSMGNPNPSRISVKRIYAISENPQRVVGSAEKTINFVSP